MSKKPKEITTEADPRFVLLQTRRSQTEARIGIFKNVFLGTPLRSRVAAYKKMAINWCVLTHNLWLLSRKALDIEKSLKKFPGFLRYIIYKKVKIGIRKFCVNKSKSKNILQ